jgi:hypothetical protein
VSAVTAVERLGHGRRLRDRFGDRALLGLTGLASLAAILVMVAIVLKVFGASRLAYDKFGLAFLWGRVWDANVDVYGALPFIFGTLVTSLMALVIAVPLAIAIALFLSELAPRDVGGIVGALVETLAAVPSVVLGLWGILVLGPFAANHLEPWLHDHLGFIPLFSGTPQSSGIFIAGLVHLRRAPNLFHFLFVTGCLLLICLQAIVNLGVVTGLFPRKGMSLPFISAGLSNLLLMGLLVGIFLNTQRTWGRVALSEKTRTMREVLA